MKSLKAITLPKPVHHVRFTGITSAAANQQREQDAQQTAYDRGRHDGERALSEQLLQQRTELLQLHQGVLNSLRAAVPQVTCETEKTLVELALEMARKIVAGIPIDVPLVEAVVRDAVSQLEDSSEITVYLHPTDLQLLRKHQSPILQGLPDADALHFAGSPEVSPGGCIVRTRFGLLDARRETKIEQLRQSFSS